MLKITQTFMYLMRDINGYDFRKMSLRPTFRAFKILCVFLEKYAVEKNLYLYKI